MECQAQNIGLAHGSLSTTCVRYELPLKRRYTASISEVPILIASSISVKCFIHLGTAPHAIFGITGALNDLNRHVRFEQSR